MVALPCVNEALDEACLRGCLSWGTRLPDWQFEGGGARLWPTEVGSVSGLANLRRICWIIRSPREGNITRPTIKIHHALEWRLHYMEESECKEKNIIWNQWSRPCRIGIDNTMRILRFMEGQFRSSVSLLTQAFVRRNNMYNIINYKNLLQCPELSHRVVASVSVTYSHI